MKIYEKPMAIVKKIEVEDVIASSKDGRVNLTPQEIDFLGGSSGATAFLFNW